MKEIVAPEFWDHAVPLLARGEADEGTMFGMRCLRVRGEFMAMPYYDGPGLVVKLPRTRVQALVAAELGRPIAPNGRVFKEWLHVPAYAPALWDELLAEARAFVTR